MTEHSNSAHTGETAERSKQMGGVDHEFKSHPDVFWPAARGEKLFEFRRDDRPGGFHVGQTVRLNCYDPEQDAHGQHYLDRRITNILRGGEFELPAGFCILSLAPTPSPALDQGLREALDTIREALVGIADDYMTSEKRHIGYVLIPAVKFEQLREAEKMSRGAFWSGISIPADVTQPMSDNLLRIYRRIANGSQGAFMAPGDVAHLIAEIDRLRAALAGHHLRDKDRERVVVDVTPMHLSDNRVDYFVRLTCGERSQTPHVFRERYKAEYEAAHLQWVLGIRADEPDLMAYSEATCPNNASPTAPTPSETAEPAGDLLISSLPSGKRCFVYCGDGICTCQERPLLPAEIEALSNWTLAPQPARPVGEEALREALKRVVEAIKPFADRVFNDNGDVSVSDTYLCGLEEFTGAYFAHRVGERVLAQTQEATGQGAGDGAEIKPPATIWHVVVSIPGLNIDHYIASESEPSHEEITRAWQAGGGTSVPKFRDFKGPLRDAYPGITTVQPIKIWSASPASKPATGEV